jgi:hypothetical protein
MAPQQKEYGPSQKSTGRSLEQRCQQQHMGIGWHWMFGNRDTARFGYDILSLHCSGVLNEPGTTGNIWGWRWAILDLEMLRKLQRFREAGFGPDIGGRWSMDCDTAVYYVLFRCTYF